MFPSPVTLLSTHSPPPAPSDIGRATVGPPDIFGQALQVRYSPSDSDHLQLSSSMSFLQGTSNAVASRATIKSVMGNQCSANINSAMLSSPTPSDLSFYSGHLRSSSMSFSHAWDADARGSISNVVSRNQSSVNINSPMLYNSNDSDSLALLLSPVPDSTYHSIRSGCMEGTRQEIIGQIDGWINGGSDQHMCWLHGAAGDGKSVIARTIAERCAASKRLAASFFFRGAGHRSKITHFISTIAYNLGFSIPATRPYIDSILQRDPYIIQQSLEHQFRTLIAQPLQSVAPSQVISLPMVVVIDGLDECDDKMRIVEFIEIVASTFRDHQFPLRFFFTSRAEEHIQQAFSASPVVPATYSLALQDFKADADIRIFFRARFSTIYQQNRQLMGNITPPWPSESDLDKLVEKTSGSFILAFTLINFVNNGSDLPHRKLQAYLQCGNHKSNNSAEDFSGIFRVCKHNFRWET